MNYSLKQNDLGTLYEASTEKNASFYFYGVTGTTDWKRAKLATSDDLTEQTNTYKFCSQVETAIPTMIYTTPFRENPPFTQPFFSPGVTVENVVSVIPGIFSKLSVNDF